MNERLVWVLSGFDPQRDLLLTEEILDVNQSDLQALRRFLGLPSDHVMYGSYPLNQHIVDYLIAERKIDSDFDFSGKSFFLECYKKESC